jgi:hypothetical protein
MLNEVDNGTVVYIVTGCESVAVLAGVDESVAVSVTVNVPAVA